MSLLAPTNTRAAGVTKFWMPVTKDRYLALFQSKGSRISIKKVRRTRSRWAGMVWEMGRTSPGLQCSGCTGCISWLQVCFRRCQGKQSSAYYDSPSRKVKAEWHLSRRWDLGWATLKINFCHFAIKHCMNRNITALQTVIESQSHYTWKRTLWW